MVPLGRQLLRNQSRLEAFDNLMIDFFSEYSSKGRDLKVKAVSLILTLT